MEKYKEKYNELLKRYYKGNDYLSNIDINNPNYDYYFKIFQEIQNKIYKIVEQHSEMTNEEILNGFH